MNCEQAQNLFDTYLDGELTGSLGPEFDAHRLSCAACRRELALREVAGHIVAADTQRPLLDEEFTERLLACALAAPLPWHQRYRRWRYIGVPLAAAAALALAIMYFARPSAPREVAGYRERIQDSAELMQKVDDALSRSPDNPQLREISQLLHAVQSRGEELVGGTGDVEKLLDKYRRETIIKILESLPIDGAAPSRGGSSGPPTSESQHDPSVEDL